VITSRSDVSALRSNEQRDYTISAQLVRPRARAVICTRARMIDEERGTFKINVKVEQKYYNRAVMYMYRPIYKRGDSSLM